MKYIEGITNSAQLYLELEGNPPLLKQIMRDVKKECGPRIENDLPKVLFEYAMAIGDTKLLQSVVDRNSKRMYTHDVEVAMLIKNGSRAEPILATRTRKQDEIDWMKWRVEGIVRGQYNKPSFPAYCDSEISNLGTMESNRTIQKGSTHWRASSYLGLRFTKIATTKQNGSQRFRFKHRFYGLSTVVYDSWTEESVRLPGMRTTLNTFVN